MRGRVTCHGRGAYATGIKHEGRYSRQYEDHLGITGSTHWHDLMHGLLSVEERQCLPYPLTSDKQKVYRLDVCSYACTAAVMSIPLLVCLSGVLLCWRHRLVQSS
jgi:hypothetical protein